MNVCMSQYFHVMRDLNVYMSPYSHVRWNLNAYMAQNSQGFQASYVINKVTEESFDEHQQTIFCFLESA
jgi:succinate dehydrogenase/fumarate reductase-like Fe-S protein